VGSRLFPSRCDYTPRKDRIEKLPLPARNLLDYRPCHFTGTNQSHSTPLHLDQNFFADGINVHQANQVH
jgi:hypothetical protein